MNNAGIILPNTDEKYKIPLDKSRPPDTIHHMKTTFVLCWLILLITGASAFSDIGLIDKPKTLGYFLLAPIDGGNLSSGLVYNQKQNEKMAFEASLTAYKSIYLLTKNVTKIRLDQKYKVGQYGPVGLTVLAGPAIYYAPAVGPGLALDLGGILTLDIADGLVASVPLNMIFFSDGREVNLAPTLSWRPAFRPDLEIFGGARIEPQLVGASIDNTSSGKINFYLCAGVRTGL